MDKNHFEFFASKDYKTLFATFGFELPFLPDLISSDSFGIPLEHEHSHLLNQQIRFIRMFHPQSQADTIVNNLFDLPPQNTAALELRFVSRNGKSSNSGDRKIEIFILGRVSCTENLTNKKREDLDKIHAHINKYALELQQHIQKTSPLEYSLRPLTDDNWTRATPLNLELINDPKCTAEICRYTEIEGSDEFAYPLLWSKNTFTQLCKLLQESTETIILSISIQPDLSLTTDEKEMLQRLSIDTASMEIDGINSEFIRQGAKRRRGAKASAADYYLRTLQKPLLLRIQVISDQPISEGLLQAIGEEISPTQDVGDHDDSFFGIWRPFQYRYPDESTLQLALDNFRYMKRDIWDKSFRSRLKYLVGATEANSAFRIPLVGPYGLPGVDVIPFNPFAVHRQTTKKNQNDELVKLGHDIHGREFNISVSDFARHALIVGATGSGKTTTCQAILNQLIEKGPPFLVIEPVKSEYRRLAFGKNAKLHNILVFTLGGIVSPFQFNPFRIPKGVSVGSYISALKSCFMAAFPMDGYLSVILERVIRAAYEAEGWKNPIWRVTGKETWSFPTLDKIYDQTVKFVQNSGYGQEIKQNIEAALVQRLSNLREGILGTILSSSQPALWDWEDLFERPVIFELDEIVDDDEKALLMALIFTILSFHRKTNSQVNDKSVVSEVKHITLIEEAHRLFSSSGTSQREEAVSTQAKNIGIFTDMLAEMRALGEGILIAEQIPTKLAKDIIKHPEMKIMHRITAEEDRQVLGSAMNFTENHRKYVTSLDRGMAAVYVEGLRAPILIKVEPFESVNSDEDGSGTPKFESSPTEGDLFDRMALIRLAKALSNYSTDVDTLGKWLEEFRDQSINYKKISTNEWVDYIADLLFKVSQSSPNLTEICQSVYRVCNNMYKRD